MFDQTTWSNDEQETKRVESISEPKTIDDIDLTEIRRGPVSKFVLAFLVGFVFFLFPIPWDGQVTVPFDIVVNWITGSFPMFAGVYALLLIITGGLLTTIAEFRKRGFLSIDDDLAGKLTLPYWETSAPFWFFRVAGAILAPFLFLEVGPAG